MENTITINKFQDITIVKEPLKWSPIENENWLIYKVVGLGEYYTTLQMEGIEVRLIPSIQDRTVSFDISQLAVQLYNHKESTEVPHVWAEPIRAGLRGDIIIRMYKVGTTTEVARKVLKYSLIGGYSPIKDINYEVKDLSVLGSSYKEYFEGFPFWLDVMSNPTTFQGLTSVSKFREIKLQSKSSPQEYKVTGLFDPISRIWIDRVVSNTNTNNLFQLNRLLNKVDIEEGGSVEINKSFCNSGIYLKWYNRDGGFSSYLFKRDNNFQYISSSLGTTVSRSKYNVGEIGRNSPVIEIGKVSEYEVGIRADVNEKQSRDMIDLLSSPKVYMWSSEKPYTPGKWFQVLSKVDVNIMRGRKTRVTGIMTMPLAKR